MAGEAENGWVAGATAGVAAMTGAVIVVEGVGTMVGAC
jgi:hypothetical protein